MGDTDKNGRREKFRWFRPKIWGGWLLAIAGWLLVGVFALAAIGIPLFQIFTWLKTGKWWEVSVSTVLQVFGLKPDWPYNPQDWVGIAGIIRWFLELHASFLFALLWVWSWGLAKVGEEDISGDGGDIS